MWGPYGNVFCWSWAFFPPICHGIHQASTSSKLLSTAEQIDLAKVKYQLVTKGASHVLIQELTVKGMDVFEAIKISSLGYYISTEA